jgi:lactoylglutathione lyase
MDHFVQIIGILSALLTTAAFLPQVIQTWRTRSTADLSPMMFTLFSIGILGWLIYGILKHDLPIILANSVTICLAGTIMFFILIGDKSVKIAHLAIYVDDLEAMKSFYCETFNGRESKKYINKNRKFSSYFIHLPSGAKIELMHLENSTNENEINSWGHIAFSVGSRKRVDRLTELLRSRAIPVISEPRLTGDGFYESIVSDPEGNRIEITI